MGATTGQRQTGISRQVKALADLENQALSAGQGPTIEEEEMKEKKGEKKMVSVSYTLSEWVKQEDFANVKKIGMELSVPWTQKRIIGARHAALYSEFVKALVEHLSECKETEKLENLHNLSGYWSEEGKIQRIGGQHPQNWNLTSDITFEHPQVGKKTWYLWKAKSGKGLSPSEFWSRARKMVETVDPENIEKYILTITTEGNEKMANDLVKELLELVNNHQYQIVLTGAPGTGKTHAAMELARAYYGDSKDDAFSKDHQELVQFHPSYDYTDFVEGLRPVENVEGEMVFRKVDGTFKAFCRRAAGKPGELYFFIIDEINRADLSKVFGELMFGLERDKRGKDNPFKTQYVNLPTCDEKGKPLDDDVFKGGFFIPENVVVIGTMNDIDRSVESIDFALRRRFVWHEVKVTEEMLKGALRVILKKPDLADNVAHRVDAFNQKLKEKGEKYGINESYFISWGYFTDIPNDKSKSFKYIMEWVWEYRVGPLIQEYFRGYKVEFLGELETAWKTPAPEEERAPSQGQPAEGNGQ